MPGVSWPHIQRAFLLVNSVGGATGTPRVLHAKLSIIMRTTLQSIGAIYGFFGLMSLLTFGYIFQYSPSIEALKSGSLKMYIVFWGICVTNAIIGALICFSFCCLKAWGRYLAIGVNVVWIGTVTVGYFAGRMTDSTMPLFDRSTLLFIGLFLLLPVAITWFLLRPDVKMFMKKN